MLTSLRLRNFKQFRLVEIELGSPVLLWGPSGSGKTSVLQSLLLWSEGVAALQRNAVQRSNTGAGRTLATMDRREWQGLGVPSTDLLWTDRMVFPPPNAPGAKAPELEVTLTGAGASGVWECGLQFACASPETLYCLGPEVKEAQEVHLLPIPAGGLLPVEEPRRESHAVDVEATAGRGMDVLRQLCLRLLGRADGWARTNVELETLFGVRLREPTVDPNTAEVKVSFLTHSGASLDLSSAGSGLVRVLLALAVIRNYPGTVVLLEEPETHLDPLSVREALSLLVRVAQENRCQLILTSQSAVVLDEMADLGMAVDLSGACQRVDARTRPTVRRLVNMVSYTLSAQAAHAGWVAYLGGASDLEALRGFAAALGHPAQYALRRPPVRYVGHQVETINRQFLALQAVHPYVQGFALLEGPMNGLPLADGLRFHCWSRQGIENYVCVPEALTAWSQEFGQRRGMPQAGAVFREAMAEIEASLRLLRRGSPWEPDFRVVEEFLDPLFAHFYQKLGLPNESLSCGYPFLTRYVPAEKVDLEVVAALDLLAAVAQEGRAGG